jgi:PIN domain nuclease of toxin-antitoxin system
MSDVILDASAFLALVNQEQGHEVVAEVISHAVMSSVNACEVIGELSSKLEIATDDCIKIINSLIRVVDFTYSQSIVAGGLKNETSHLGLSLGDRACLSLGMDLKLPVYTADRIWSKVNCGAEIIVIR